MEYQLNGELVSVLAAAGPDDERLDRAARHLRSDREGQHRLLERLATDRSFAVSVAGDSYWHANGFAKLTLHRSAAPLFKLRLHIWARGEAPPTAGVGGGNTHTHRWAFGSVVLCGELATHQFEESLDHEDPKAIPCHKLAYDSPKVGISGTLRPIGACLLRPTGSAVHAVGDLHLGRIDTIHRVAPVGDLPAATLFVQGPNREPTAYVYEEPGHTAVEDTRSAISPAEVMELAALIGSAHEAASREKEAP